MTSNTDNKLVDVLAEAREEYKKCSEAYDRMADEYWDNLSHDDQLTAFYCVVKRIHQAEVVDRGSYRWSLYDVFGFGFEAYAVGMDCGYLDIHNYIFNGIEAEKKNDNKD